MKLEKLLAGGERLWYEEAVADIDKRMRKYCFVMRRH